MKKKRLARLKPFLPLYLMLLPGMLYILVNNYIPMTGIIVAFKKFNVNDGIYGSPWNNMDNFGYLFGTRDAFIIFRNTLLYNAAFIILTNVIAIMLAIMISDVIGKRLKKLYQSSVLLPFTISIVVVSYIVFAFLSHENGMLNHWFFGENPVQWYSEGTYWPVILILVSVWKNVGYSTLLFIAGIAGIDRSLYEAADIDGASRWQQIKRITLPCLVPTITTLVLMGIGRIFYSDFGLFYQVPMNSGAIYDATTTIDTYVYRALTSAGGVGRSAAAGFFQSIVGFVLVVFANMTVRKVNRENAIY